MKFRIIAPLSALILAYSIKSQSISASYSWISGSSVSGPGTAKAASYPSSYGLISPSNTPGGRENHRAIVYNNRIYSFHGSMSPGNDVWAFNIADKTWTWLAGKSNTAAPSFGSLGVASVSNTPGLRWSFGGDLHPARNEYILFGGYIGGGSWGDLWTFDLISNTWKWVAGQSSINEIPVYNTIGVSTSSTTPGGRTGSNCVVYPPTGEFLLFGGFANERKCDLWAFNFNNLRWTWISGSSNGNVGASAGSKGAWSTGFYPESRAYDSLVLNSATNIMYIFGGNGIAGTLNDLWAFKRDTLEWAWLSGSTTASSRGYFGPLGSPGSIYYPGARFSHSMVYHPLSGLLIMFGGNGFSGIGNNGLLADTWAYNTSSNEWAWIAGSSLVATMPLSVYSFTFLPDNAMVVDPVTSNIYIFGGTGFLPPSFMVPVDYVWLGSVEFASSLVSYSVAATSISSYSSSTRQLSSAGQVSSAFARSTATSKTTVYASSVGKSTSGRDITSYSTLSTRSSTILSSVRLISSSVAVLSSAFPRFGSSLSLDPSSIVYSTTSQDSIRKSSSEITAAREVFSIFESPSSVEKMSSPGNEHFGEISLTKQRVETKSSQNTDIPQDFMSTKLWSMKFRILAVTLVALLIVTNCVAFKFACQARANRRDASTKSDNSSLFAADFRTTTTTSSSTPGQTTLAVSTVGVYIPGALRVDGVVAYRQNREIARGGGGSVWLATAFDTQLKEYGENVIVKVPNAKLMNERAVALFHQEIALMNAFKQNQNIAKLLGYSENPYSTILKFYPNGSLSKWIMVGARTVNQAHAFMKDIAVGLTMMHSHGVVHCDLKPDNVLIDYGTRLFAVITDFGISRIVTQKLLKVRAYDVQLIRGASLNYAAPEVIDELRGSLMNPLAPNITMARDIYALGMMLADMLNGDFGWRRQKVL